ATPEEQMAIETPPGVGDRQAAGPVRQALVQGAKARYNAQAQTWEGLDQRLQGATLNPESQTALADASSAFQEKYAKFQNTSPEFNIMQGAKRISQGSKPLVMFKNGRAVWVGSSGTITKFRKPHIGTSAR